MKKAGLIICLLCVFILNAQPPKNFYTKFGGNGIEVGYAVKQTLDKQYIVAGSTTTYGFGNTDFYLLKIDSMGKLLWEKTYGGFSNDVARSVIQLPDSGFVMVGYSNSFGNGGYDMLTIRTDKVGNVIWQRSFGGIDWDFGYDVAQASDGGIVTCGSTYSFGNGKIDGCIIKYDITGNLLWQKFFGGAEDDDIRAIIKTSDNNIAAVGCNKSIHDIEGDAFFVKLNNNGDTIFTRYYGGPYKDHANDLVQKANNDYVVGGATTFSANAKTRSYMFSMDANGNALWNNSFYFGPTNNEEWVTMANSLHKPAYTAYIRNDQIQNFSQQGTIFYAQPPGGADIINSNGGYKDETLYSIDGTKDGGFVSVGTTESFGSQNGDLYFIKQDTNLINYADAVGFYENIKQESFVFIKKEKSKIFEAENLHGDLFDKVTIYDLTGKIIKQINCRNESEIINMTEYGNSVYLLMFTRQNKLIYKAKIIND